MNDPRDSEKDEAEDCDCECRPGSGWRPSTTDLLLWTAQRAKMQLIQEKVKTAIEARRGKVYDKLAGVLADHVAKVAGRDREARADYDDLKSRIDTIMEGKK